MRRSTMPRNRWERHIRTSRTPELVIRTTGSNHLLSLGQISAAISEMSEANKDLLEKYRKEVALRRKYHEQLVELKGEQRGNQLSEQEVHSASMTLLLWPLGNIRVLCRVKPVLKEDQHEEGQSVVVVTTDPNNESCLSVLSKGKSRVFEMDKVFHPQAAQEEVQPSAAGMLRIQEGYNRKLITSTLCPVRSSRRLNLWSRPASTATTSAYSPTGRRARAKRTPWRCVFRLSSRNGGAKGGRRLTLCRFKSYRAAFRIPASTRGPSNTSLV